MAKMYGFNIAETDKVCKKTVEVKTVQDGYKIKKAKVL
jgi:hypothetical protein